jgi:NAD(P)-dependent dehydrogenase (short-subunit alcohol dehydrogenase family)
MQDLEGKVAFITGGASGIGLAMARSFAAAGMKVVIADIQTDALEKAAAGLKGSNADVLAIELDVTDRDAMARAADEAEAAFGNVHVLCNNAGVAAFGPLIDATYEDWDWVIGVNLHGVINGIQTFLPRIKGHGEGGHVVNTASIAGHVALPGLGIYNATKYAVVGISETLVQELEPDGIGVSVLCPGFVDTNIYDSQRNRPKALQNPDSDPGQEFLGGSEQVEQVEQVRQSAMDPALVGEKVLEAVRNNEFYILTHPDFRPLVEGRMQNILEGFERR